MEEVLTLLGRSPSIYQLFTSHCHPTDGSGMVTGRDNYLKEVFTQAGDMPGTGLWLNDTKEPVQVRQAGQTVAACNPEG